MNTENRGQNYQHWLAKINQVCGQFAARPLDDHFHGEIDASYAGDLKVSTVTARGINLYRTRQEISAIMTLVLYRLPARGPGDDRAGWPPGDAGERRYHPD